MFNKFFKRLKYFFIGLVVIVVAWSVNFLLVGNFHKVDDNLYRSAQLFSFNYPYYIEKNKIKSIINLRGDSSSDWYINEKKISKEYGIKHYDFGISDKSILSIEKMDKLVELMKQAPKPLLIHCKAGADRTSLATALYLLKIKDDKNAQKAISIKYGHFPWLGSRTIAMDKSFENYLLNLQKK